MAVGPTFGFSISDMVQSIHKQTGSKPLLGYQKHLRHFSKHALVWVKVLVLCGHRGIPKDTNRQSRSLPGTSSWVSLLEKGWGCKACRVFLCTTRSELQGHNQKSYQDSLACLALHSLSCLTTSSFIPRSACYGKPRCGVRGLGWGNLTAAGF